jgi:hypothetical protein
MHDESVDYYLDRVALVLVEGLNLVEIEHLPVDADSDEALLARRLEDAVALRLAVTDQWAQDQQPAAVRQSEDAIDDLRDALALDLMAVGAVRVADAGEQQAEVVVYLGHGADRRPGVSARALLVDADRWREAVDLVDVRLLHLAEELPGVGRQALDVAALSLCVDRVEGEA